MAMLAEIQFDKTSESTSSHAWPYDEVV